MALVLNGSNNTIGGLAVGGLPDGSVALADLSATGTAGAGNFLRGDNSWTASTKWTQGAATSIGTGTSFLFDNIPSTAALIVITYNYVSGSSTNADNFIMRAGTSSGIVTTNGASRGLSAYMQDNDNGEVQAGDDNIPLAPYAWTAHDGYYHGHVILTKWDTGKYHAQGACFQGLSNRGNAPNVYGITLTGEIYLSAALAKLQLQFHNGTGTFDEGDVAIAYLEP